MLFTMKSVQITISKNYIFLHSGNPVISMRWELRPTVISEANLDGKIKEEQHKKCRHRNFRNLEYVIIFLTNIEFIRAQSCFEAIHGDTLDDRLS